MVFCSVTFHMMHSRVPSMPTDTSCCSSGSGTAAFGEGASFGEDDSPIFTQGPLSSPLHQFFQQQIHAHKHTRSVGSKHFFSNLTFNFQPLQLLFLFSAEFTFLPQ